MITIKNIATELEDILNGTSANVPESATRPFEGLFAVRTEGYHLDNVTDYQTGKNFFPVFLGEPTGEFNPIAGLEQMDMEIPVSIYFPVRFKDKMLDMQEFLANIFIGRAIGFNLTDGKYGQYAVCNISIPELGEITDMDVDQFGNSVLKGLNEFIEEQYKMPVNTAEPWICLTFSLYLTTMKNALSTENGATLYGNAYEVSCTYQDWTETMETDGITISFGAQTESQQGFELETGTADTQSKSYATTNATSFTFEAPIKRTAFWFQIMHALLQGKLKPNDFELHITLKDEYKSGEDEDYADYGMNQTTVVCTGFTTTIGVNKALCAQFTFTPLAEVQ